MDDVITRIVEIEQQCSADVEKVQLEYKNRIEAHKQFLKGKKTREHDQIISTENIKLTHAIDEAKIKIKADSAAFEKDNEILFQDPVLNERIKEDIISILLTS